MSCQSVLKSERLRDQPSIFQVPDSVPDSQPIKGGVRELHLHKHVMKFERKRGEFRVSLKELHNTDEARQKNRRDIYHVMGGAGSVVLDGKEHRLAKGSLVVIAPTCEFSFRVRSGKPLIV